MSAEKPSVYILPLWVRILVGIVSGLIMIVSLRAYFKPAAKTASIPSDPAHVPDAPHKLPIAHAPGEPIVSEPQAPLPAYTNEELQQELEREKVRMGVRKVLPLHGDDEPHLPVKPAGLALASTDQKTAVLRADDSASRKFPRVILSAEELATTWAALGGTLPPPTVDFTREMVMLFDEPTAVVNIETQADRLIVHYQPLPQKPGARRAGPSYHTFFRSELTPQFRKLLL